MLCDADASLVPEAAFPVTVNVVADVTEAASPFTESPETDRSRFGVAGSCTMLHEAPANEVATAPATLLPARNAVGSDNVAVGVSSAAVRTSPFARKK